MHCSNCGTENRVDARFYGGCGSVLARACPACGKANDPGMRFCTECGTPLDAEPLLAEARDIFGTLEATRGSSE